MREPASPMTAVQAALLALLLTLLAPVAAARTLGTIHFSRCEIAVSSASRYDAECARFSVPENPAEPQGRRIQLRLALIPARSPQPKPEPVVFLAGGPGQSAIDAYPAVAATLGPLARDRNVLLIDQRGTGGSNPLECALPDVFDEAAESAANARIQAFECLRGLLERADPAFYTTLDFLRDLEAIRAALGGPQFDLVAGSYGTRVALEYLRRHPDAVRSAVLDSVVPPELALMQDHPRNLDEALDQMFAQCRASAACSERFGDPAKTLSGLRAKLRTSQPLVSFRDPDSNQLRQARFSGGLLAGVVRLFSYAPEAASLLPLLLDEAAHGRPEVLMAQASRFADFARGIAHGQELSVICNEDADYAHADPSDEGRLLGNDMVHLIQAQCEVWPRSAPSPALKQPVSSDKPVLVLSGSLDPVTPPRYGAQVLKTLGKARQLIALGQGHIVMNRGCMPRLIRRFIERPEPAQLDASCLDALGYTPAFVSFQGPPP
ncbi:MAG TPA: alpha/beta fold hydrolase [Solimonas sp.]|nr:alpha/beta fold hydrolase [Solimonas sp.]